MVELKTGRNTTRYADAGEDCGAWHRVRQSTPDTRTLLEDVVNQRAARATMALQCGMTGTPAMR